MKRIGWVNVLRIIVIMAVIGFSMIACSDDNRLSGTWEFAGGRAGVTTIEFVGNNFILTDYPSLSRHQGQWGVFTEQWGGIPAFSDGRINREALVRVSEEIWPVSELFQYRRVLNGTYSISDGQIELVFSDSGTINVLNFSRTENTITLGGSRLTQRQ